MSDDVQSLLAFVLFCAVLFLVARAFSPRKRVRKSQPERSTYRPKQDWTTHEPPWTVRQTDPAEQLRVVMAAEFSVQSLLNKSEARLFKELDRMVLARNPEWQVMAQVSLGEILRTKDKVAYSCVNSKRVDLLLVDAGCRPRHAIEYQGAGHYQSTAAARDAVKKEALRKAGIGYTEIVKGEVKPSDLMRLVERLVDLPESEAPFLRPVPNPGKPEPDRQPTM